MTEQQRKNLLAKYMEGLQLSENELVQTLSHVICLKETEVTIEQDNRSKMELSALYTAKNAVELMLNFYYSNIQHMKTDEDFYFDKEDVRRMLENSSDEMKVIFKLLVDFLQKDAEMHPSNEDNSCVSDGNAGIFCILPIEFTGKV